MMAVDLSSLRTRRDADRQLARTISDRGLRQFLLTNLSYSQGRYSWRLNLTALRQDLKQLRSPPLNPSDEFVGPTYFVIGGRSGFVEPDDEALIRRHFPAAQLHRIESSGHNPHMEAREELVQFLRSRIPAAHLPAS